MANELVSPPLSKPSFDVTGRGFVITGGTQGLGLEIARLLKENGASGLALVSRSEIKGADAIKELNDAACKCAWLQADLSKADDAASVIPRAVDALEVPVSGVVNAAAITNRGSLLTETAHGFDLQFAINVRAPFLINQAAAKHMMESKGTSRSIVNICSVAAHGGAPFVMAYSAAKAALVNLTKTNAAELAPHGIRVNAVNMGWCLTDNENVIQTRQDGTDWIERADASVPLGRILRPRDIASTVVFLLSDASALMTGSIVDHHPEFAHGLLSLASKEGKGAR